MSWSQARGRILLRLRKSGRVTLVMSGVTLVLQYAPFNRKGRLDFLCFI